MFQSKQLHNDESGQTALETAIILIAFVVVASVFAFTVLSAGQVSTEKGESAIYAGLQQVESSMAVKGAVIAEADDPATPAEVKSIAVTVALATGGDPVNLASPGATFAENAGGTSTLTYAAGDNTVVISYRDDLQNIVEVIGWTLVWVGANDDDSMLEDGELAMLTIPVGSAANALIENMEFTVEIKPPTGAVLNITRTTPAALEPFMELR